jgi:ankyrin repeat domain-containing protein 50
LHIAAEKGYLEVISVLLDAGANSLAVDSIGNTPHHWAVLKGRTECAELLALQGTSLS